MKRMLVSLIIFGTISLVTACVPIDESIPKEESQGQSEELVEDSKQLLGKGIGPLEITPDTFDGNSNDHLNGDLSAGNISSSGKQSARTSTIEQPGFIESIEAGERKVDREVNWRTYLDASFHFSIDHPEFYVILPENDPLLLSDSTLKHRVRFQDIELAEGDTAEYEIPKFTIEIHELGSQSLESYLDSQSPGAEREAIQIGDLAGLKISLKNLRAPNMYYFFQSNGNSYKLTPLGEYGDEMLQSFQILP